MKLSELVNFYNRLSNFEVPAVQKLADQELAKITDIAQDIKLDQLKDNVISAFEQFNSGLNELKKKVQDKIREDEKIYLQNSYNIYEEEKFYVHKEFYTDDSQTHFTDQEIKNYRIQHQVEILLRNQLDISPAGRDLLSVRIERHSSWQHSGLIIHPGRENWIDLMLGNDPLYIVDQHYDLLSPTISRFNETYQKRLRPYVIKEDFDSEILTRIPNNQFGVVLVYGYFDYKPFEIIRQYLSELYNKVRPGGTVLMTFNDCDRWPAVLASEVSVMRYTPGWMVRDWAKVLGFEIKFDWNEDGTWSWLELQKPGEFKSLRGGQSLAKIISK